MATPLQTIYDAFLAKVEADDWALTEMEKFPQRFIGKIGV